VSSATQPDAPRVDVELDIFSGRENPSWTLAGEAARTLVQKLSELSSGPVSPEPANLGYRGFVLHVPEGRWRVWNGTAALFPALHPTDARGYRDDQQVEEWLVSFAERLGHGPTIERLRSR
jgi:hypothetical protein